ncbi:winged helix-turn-helix transcriptional regulator [Actinomadura sp. 9N407]|uniref:winged helix-turn-helix transcriptional regulator n=1 Tax=Actinomadura sp. 9N407 TaxID=3375154 RepID=UPI0037B024FB
MVAVSCSRTAYAEVPPRVEYALAPLDGGLNEIVMQLIGWAADHHDEIRADRSRAVERALRRGPVLSA